MKSHYNFITAIVVTAAGFGVFGNAVADSSDAQASTQQLGDHPAVIVARTQAKRGIDPNTFIVKPPAAVQMLAASPNAKSARPAKAKVASTAAR